MYLYKYCIKIPITSQHIVMIEVNFQEMNHTCIYSHNKRKQYNARRQRVHDDNDDYVLWLWMWRWVEIMWWCLCVILIIIATTKRWRLLSLSLSNIQWEEKKSTWNSKSKYREKKITIECFLVILITLKLRPEYYIYHRKVFAKIYTYHTYLLVTFFRFVNNNQV